MTINELQKLRMAKISNYSINELSDISEFKTDSQKNVTDRVCGFLKTVTNPYVFRVGQNPVKVRFLYEDFGDSIQDSLLKVIESQI